MAHPWPDERDPRVPVGRVHQLLGSVAEEPGVCVQDEHVLAGGLRDASVPARRESPVLRLDERDGGEPLADELDRAVARAVVDDDRLEGGDALEALLEPGQRVVGDDDAGEPTRVSHARAAVASLLASLPRGGSPRPAARGRW